MHSKSKSVRRFWQKQNFCDAKNCTSTRRLMVFSQVCSFLIGEMWRLKEVVSVLPSHFPSLLFVPPLSFSCFSYQKKRSSRHTSLQRYFCRLIWERHHPTKFLGPGLSSGHVNFDGCCFSMPFQAWRYRNLETRLVRLILLHCWHYWQRRQPKRFERNAYWTIIQTSVISGTKMLRTCSSFRLHPH